MSTKTGKIIKWIEKRGFGFIRPEGTKDEIFVHVSEIDLPESAIKEGTAVEFEVIEGKKGLRAENVRAPGQYDLPDKGYRFLNPYNFARYLPDRQITEEDDTTLQLLGRCAPPPHDRWVGLSGKIECRAEAVTPVFIADSEGVKEEKKISQKKRHYSYRFFRLGGQKTIPATTLRGVVRSVFETVTNSCFANFTGQRLSYRLPSSEVQKLVPGRVEKDGDGNWCLRLLTGQAPFAPERGQKKGLYAAPARFYRALVPTGRRRSNPSDPIADAPDTWEHGQPYHAVLINVKFPPSWRVLALAEDETEANRLMSELRQNPRQDLKVQSGWLCKTNQNADAKNSERFFFRDTTDPSVPERIPLSKKVCRNYEELIQDYQIRHADAVKKRETPGEVENGEIAFSRFVLEGSERHLRGGELVYARLERQQGQLRVKFMAPVSWPRVAYEHTIADLLPPHLHKCNVADHLCPACRTFGWVWDGEGEEPDYKAYAGRVRFSHAALDSKQTGEKTESMTLSILGSPKPTTTRFYLAGPDGKPSNRPRGDLEVGYDGNSGRNKLRGRKFYRHFIPEEKHLLSREQSDQNRTIREREAVGKGSVFNFSVTFENLAPVELGALLWSLTLDDKGYHKVGYAKPLGLGSMAVTIEEVKLDNAVARYHSLEETGRRQLPEGEQAQLVKTFHEASVRPYAAPEIIAFGEEKGASAWKAVFEELPNVQDLLALLGREAPSLPVHYPYSPDPKSNGSFEWFVGNNRLKGPRKELPLATEDKGLPLVNRDGEKH